MSELQFEEFMKAVDTYVESMCVSSGAMFFIAGAMVTFVFQGIVNYICDGVVYVFKKIREREPKDVS